MIQGTLLLFVDCFMVVPCVFLSKIVEESWGMLQGVIQCTLLLFVGPFLVVPYVFPSKIVEESWEMLRGVIRGHSLFVGRFLVVRCVFQVILDYLSGLKCLRE